MFYVYLLNSSTKKARSKYETNKKKNSYDFCVSLCIKYLVPRFYTELSNLYLGIEKRVSIRYVDYLIKKHNFHKDYDRFNSVDWNHRGYTLPRFVIMICLQCSRYRVFKKNIIYVAYDITYTDFAMRSVIERNHDQTHNWLWHV